MSTPLEKAKNEITAALPGALDELIKSMRFAPHFHMSSGKSVGVLRLNGREMQVQLKLEADPEEFMGLTGEDEEDE